MSEFSDLSNLALEREVLGQMIGFPGVYEQYVGLGLHRTDFFREMHRKVFDAIAVVADRGDTPGMVTVSLELQRDPAVMEEVGYSYYSRLTDDVMRPPADTLVLIAAELATLAGKREVFRSLGKSLEDIAAVAEQATSRATDERRVYDALGQLETIRQDIKRDSQGTIALGFGALDVSLGGLRSGEVLGLMARPGIGKTLVLCQVARSMADTEYGHVFFSLEMPAAQIVERIARAHYGLSRGYLRGRLEHGGLDPDDYIQTFKRLVVVDAPGLSVAQMSAKIRQIQASTLKGIPIRLVTVDHLGLIGGDRRMTTSDRVSTQARELQELAKRFDASLLLAVQVNRESGGDGSKELTLGSARDSGVVEEAMDYLVAMRRPERSQTLSPFERERYRDTLFLKVVKNRHGAPDTEIGVRLDGMTLRLLEDASLVIQDDDLSKIAAQAGGRRR
jgi:replicative DNA helicase